MFTLLLSLFLGNVMAALHAQIPESVVFNSFTHAIVANKKSWCSPAVLVGPRIFLTAAHCTPLIEPQRIVRVFGPSLNTFIPINIERTEITTDEGFLSGSKCKAVVSKLGTRTDLTPSELTECWFNDGAPDIAMLIADRDLPGPMLTVSNLPLKPSERVAFLSQIPTCGGDKGLFELFSLSTFSFSGTHAIFFDPTVASDCRGGSGGIYYRPDEQYLEIVAIHSATTPENLAIKVHGKEVTIPAHYFGGTNITNPKIMTWVKGVALKQKLSICGINYECPLIPLSTLFRN